MEKIEEKFKKIGRRYETGKIGFYQALEESYTTRNDEVVKMIEHEIAQVKLEISTHGSNYINGVRIETLTTLLQTIKDK